MTVVSLEKTVNAPVQQVYRAFTNATLLTQWMCDYATVEPRPRGRIYLWWAGDFYSSGEFQEVEENKKISFLWHSRNEPAPTLVTVAFAEKNGSVLVKLDHTVPDEKGWEKAAEIFRENWEPALEALAFMLEKGMDYRIVKRPMLGIYPGDFTKEQAEKLGIPVTTGVRLDGLVDGMSAQKAGLLKQDVIVSLNGVEMTGFNSFAAALQGKKAGDVVEVVLYRGAEKKTIQMELSPRPMPEVPSDLNELVKKGREAIKPALNDLEKCFEGVSEAEANFKSAPNEWSALETVAHLIHGERGTSAFMDELIGGFVRVGDDFGGNIDAHVRATISVYPTIRAMLDELRRNVEENFAYLANLPQEFMANKIGYYTLGSIFVQGDIHIRTHIEQIKAAIAAAKKG